MTPYEEVVDHYRLPFELYPFQIEAVNELAPLQRTGLYWEPGLGKTAGSTVCALHHMLQGARTVLVLMPPILLTTWARWLSKIRYKDGGTFSVVTYAGTPAQRRQINLEGADFVLMSLPIFKKDIERLEGLLPGGTHVILDEAQAIKNVGSQNYKLYRDFVMEKSHQLLTGTPLSTPIDAYSYIKLVAPTLYRNLKHFEHLHVAAYDFFNNPVSWVNLDLLVKNMQVNTDRKTKEQVLHDLPECIVVPMEYELEKAHYQLYKCMVEDQLLKLPDDQKIDLTQSSALYHAMGQVVMGWSHFSGEPRNVSAGYGLIEEVLDELGDKKLIVFANYRRTNADIATRFGCPAVYGDITPRNKQAALDRFMEDPSCRMITMQPGSGGVGVDGLQHVCADVLFIEPPPLANYIQALSRVHRDGQKSVVTIRLACASRTIQQARLQALTEQEELVQPLQGSKVELRAALFGDASAVMARTRKEQPENMPITEEVSSVMRRLLEGVHA